MYESVIFICVALGFIFGTSLAARECHRCSSLTDPNCSDPPPGVKFEKCVTTTSEEFNCLQYKYILNNDQFTYRGCRQQKDNCNDVKQALTIENREVVNCCICSTDFCNDGVCKSTGSYEKPIFIVISLIFLAKFFVV